ncbi:MAG: 4-hydroxy-tetrahydrodipicolinate reductase [Clostridiales bacterium]|jgi:4-hydroxy-tetrahydrodipicolinate reductase|nr:4-hydroxy-tetrahydrodipicolinate reductase [Clostridiales bacterium]
MPKIIISGCNGRMGQAITRLCAERENVTIVAGFDVNAVKLSNYPVYADPMEYSGEADAVIDFSNPASLKNLLDYCTARNIPCILCTTGYSDEQLVQISHASESIPVFRSGNMSLGINLLTGLIKKAASVLGENYDVEVVERHHRTKIDAPSGTALMLAEAAASSLPYESEYIYDRHSVRQKRAKNEIGISSIRGGTIVGEHEVIFAGTDEVIEFKHTAYSRDVFANGAIAAAVFLASIKTPGMYDMNDVLSSILDV